MNEYTYEFSTYITVKAKDEDEAIAKAWEEFESSKNLDIFSMFDEYGKGV